LVNIDDAVKAVDTELLSRRVGPRVPHRCRWLDGWRPGGQRLDHWGRHDRIPHLDD